MIIVRYCGGLGNQMYQYAMQVALMAKFPMQKFKADIYHYNLLNEHNGFELPEYFGIKVEYASKKEIRNVFNGLIPGTGYKLFPLEVRKKIAFKYQNKYWSLRNHLWPEKNAKTIQDNSKEEIIEMDLSKGDWYIRGMWQDLNWFDEYRSQILDKFNWSVKLDDKDSSICNILNKGGGIAIHVRGGDFKNQRYNLCNRDYYIKALEKMPLKKLPLYIFTDDVEHAKKLFQGIDVCEMISHSINESVKDMYMMSKAKYLIISNSTFSFWGAYLNDLENNVIVCSKFSIFDGVQYREFKARRNWNVVDNKAL